MKRIQERRDFIGVQWVEDDDDDETSDEEGVISDGKRKEKPGEATARSVRLLDYACGTGAMSRVRCVILVLLDTEVIVIWL